MRTYLLALSIILLPLSLSGQDNLQQNPEQDSYDYAVTAFNKAVVQKNDALQKQDFRLAADLFSRYIARFPKHKNTVGAKYHLGYCYARSGRLPAARVIFSDLVKDYKVGPFVAKAARYLAYDSGFAKKYKEASYYYKIVAAQETDKLKVLEAWYGSGENAMMAGDEKGAMESFLKTIEISDIRSTFHQRAQIRMGHLFFKKGNFEKALKHFSKVAVKEANPILRSEATYFQGMCYYKLDKLEEAEASYEQVLRLDDKKWKGSALVDIMAVQYAREDYRGVVKSADANTMKLGKDLLAKKEILAGQSFLKLKEYRRAVEAFNAVISRYPDSSEAFEASYRKILCYYNLKSSMVPNQVNMFIRRYGVRYPKHQFMHNALMLQAETLFESKAYASAAKVYAQIDPKLISEGNRLTVLYKKAWCYSELNNHRQAVDSFTEFLTEFPEDPRKLQILNIRAKNYAALKDLRSAIRDYEKVIQLAPKTRMAGAAMQAVARLYKEQEEYGKMVLRYEAMIEDVEDLDEVVILNAHYWCAWGNFKTNRFKQAVPHIRKAMKIDKGAYAKQLAMLDVLCSYQLKDKAACVEAAKLADRVGIANDIHVEIYRWLGLQCYKAGEFADAQAFLSLGVTKLNPEKTPVFYWRLLTRCQFENQHYQWAMQSVTHAINLEEDEAHKVNMQLYKALCQERLNKPELAKATALEALKKNPSGQTKAKLLKLVGDIYYRSQNYKDAAISFASITEFYDDEVLLPYSISMIVKSLEASNKPSDAAVFRDRLAKEFPNYKLPE